MEQLHIFDLNTRVDFVSHSKEIIYIFCTTDFPVIFSIFIPNFAVNSAFNFGSITTILNTTQNYCI